MSFYVLHLSMRTVHPCQLHTDWLNAEAGAMRKHAVDMCPDIATWDMASTGSESEGSEPVFDQLGCTILHASGTTGVLRVVWMLMS